MILLVQYRLEEQGLTADRDRLRRCEALRSPAREQQGGLWSAFRSTSKLCCFVRDIVPVAADCQCHVIHAGMVVLAKESSPAHHHLR